MDGPSQEIIPLRGSILQAEACQILSLAENPRWSPSVAMRELRAKRMENFWSGGNKSAHREVRFWVLSPEKTALGQ